MIEQIMLLFSKYYPIHEALKKAIHAELIYATYPKNEILLKRGQTCRYIYFVKRGLVKGYYYDKTGQQHIVWIMKENDVVTAVYSFLRQQPDMEYIETLEETEVAYLSYETLQRLYREFLEFNVVGRMLTEHYYVVSETTKRILLVDDVTERYQVFLEHHAELEKRVSQKDIASYINTSPETLSKIRNGKY